MAPSSRFARRLRYSDGQEPGFTRDWAKLDGDVRAPASQRPSAHRIAPSGARGRTSERARERLQVSDMAKEGADMTEETERMIDRSDGKETEGAGADASGDAKEMRAVMLAGFGGLNKLRVTKKAMPEPQEGEVKIRVKAW